MIVEVVESMSLAPERDRVGAHLEFGEKSGDMKTALEAIASGEGMTMTLQAKYMTAGMNRADIDARQGETDDAAMAACKAQVKGMRDLSAERVWKELKKLLGAPNPVAALTDMAAAGVLEQVLPEAIALDLLGALIETEQREGWRPDPVLRLAALIPRMDLVVVRVRRRLKLSKVDGRRLQWWSGIGVNPRVMVGRPLDDVAAAIYPINRLAVLDRARLGWAIDRAQGETPDDDWRALITFMEEWEPPAFPVSGDDVGAVGVPKGPPTGAALKALEALWIKGGFKATREQLMAALPMVQL